MDSAGEEDTETSIGPGFGEAGGVVITAVDSCGVEEICMFRH
jgi:hypothetical protein